MHVASLFVGSCMTAAEIETSWEECICIGHCVRLADQRKYMHRGGGRLGILDSAALDTPVWSGSSRHFDAQLLVFENVIFGAKTWGWRGWGGNLSRSWASLTSIQNGGSWRCEEFTWVLFVCDGENMIRAKLRVAGLGYDGVIVYWRRALSVAKFGSWLRMEFIWGEVYR